jgi:hypothetical protein
VFELAPGPAGEQPHDLELVAVGVGTVDALCRTVEGFPREGAGFDQPGANRGEILDRRHLPRQVARPDPAAPARRGIGTQPDETEIVVVG